MYKNSDVAFGELDFSGLGYITEEAFIDSMPVKRTPYKLADLKMYFAENNLFQGSGLPFDTFKKNFFP
jgi:Ca2+-binding EF-hand superfamily protein